MMLNSLTEENKDIGVERVLAPDARSSPQATKDNGPNTLVKPSASIVAVVTNASVAPCAPQKTCLSIAVTIRSRCPIQFPCRI